MAESVVADVSVEPVSKAAVEVAVEAPTSLFGGIVQSFIVQSSWDEPEDAELHDYIQKSGLPKKDMDEEDLLKICPEPSVIVFADTSIIQQLVDHNVVPDTYPDCFKPLYHRSIAQGLFIDIGTASLPYFVKPAKGHKAFDARVVRTDEDKERVAEEAGDDAVYVCEAVEFVCEHRLFLGPGRVWGTGEYSDHVLGEEVIKSTPVPAEFIDQVTICNELGFVVVDVGLTKDGNWCVVEANPPFALSSYGLDIGIYVEYCCAAWAYVLSKQRFSEVGAHNLPMGSTDLIMAHVLDAIAYIYMHNIY